MPVLRRSIALVASAALLASCAASSPSSSVDTPTPSPSPTPSPTPIPTGPFQSTLYGYTVTSPDWAFKPATSAWDGTGAPGDGDPFVDTLIGPIPPCSRSVRRRPTPSLRSPTR